MPPTTSREQITGNPVSIDDGAERRLTWDTKILGDKLLDLTDPANPKIITSGDYAVSVSVSCSPIALGGCYAVVFALDGNGEFARVDEYSPAASQQNNGQPRVAVSETWYLKAGATITLDVVNMDGANAVEFGILQANVQRIS